jgi:hypothetical protein
MIEHYVSEVRPFAMYRGVENVSEWEDADEILGDIRCPARASLHPPSQVTKSWTPAPIAVAVHKGKIAGVAAEGSASGVTGQPVARRKAVGRRTSGCCKKTKLGSFC